jgi:hypothetical protein
MEIISKQGMIFNELTDKVERRKVSAPTGTREDRFEKHEDKIDEYLKAFPLVDYQVGVIMTVNGEIGGIRKKNLFDASPFWVGTP